MSPELSLTLSIVAGVLTGLYGIMWFYRRHNADYRIAMAVIASIVGMLHIPRIGIAASVGNEAGALFHIIMLVFWAYIASNNMYMHYYIRTGEVRARMIQEALRRSEPWSQTFTDRMRSSSNDEVIEATYKVDKKRGELESGDSVDN